MKLFSRVFVALIAVAGLLPLAANAVTSQTMITYVDKYCSKMNPISGCGSYQGEVTEARSKAMRIMNIINRYSATKQTQLRDGLVDLLGEAYNETSGVKKFLAAYYYVFFAGFDDRDTFDIEDLFDMVLDDYDDDYYDYSDDYDDYDDYEYDEEDDKTGEIVSVLSNDGDTRVNRSTKKITVNDDEMSLRILAEDNDNRDATANNNFRVVAMFENGKYEGDVYGANYESNGYREFTFSSQFDDADSVTIYLLCKDCDEGSRFNEGDVFEDRRVVDSEEYDLDFNYDNDDDDDDDDDDDYGDDDNDLGIAELIYSYDFVGNYVTVEVTTTVRNYGNEETMLDMLEYSVDVDDSNFSESNYDLVHVETDCDDSGIDEDEDEDIDIGEGDECDITVEFEFDIDDVEDERVEIEVMIESDEDEDSRNDTDVISFIPRD